MKKYAPYLKKSAPYILVLLFLIVILVFQLTSQTAKTPSVPPANPIFDEMETILTEKLSTEIDPASIYLLYFSTPYDAADDENRCNATILFMPPITSENYVAHINYIFKSIYDTITQSHYSIQDIRIDIRENDVDVLEIRSSSFTSATVYYPLEDPLTRTTDKLYIDIENIESDPTKSTFDLYVEENRIKLSCTDVQYNMSNTLDNKFILKGVASLSSYYNYGFDDSIEPNYFCIMVTPSGGSFSDRWYIYCERDVFRDFYSDLKAKDRYIETVCYIPSSYYEAGQGNMAMLQYICW